MINYAGFEPGFYENRAAIYSKLRDEEPVSFDEETGTFTLSRYEDVASAVADWQTYSCVGPWTNENSQLGALDPPEHEALLVKAKAALSHERMLSMEDDLRADARAVLEVLVAQGECELIVDYIFHCVGRLEGRLFALTDDQVAECFECVDILGHAPEQAPAVQERLAAVFLPLMAARKKSPADDLISALVTGGSDGSEALSDPLIFGFLNTLNAPLGGLAPAGVANSVALIGAHPDQQADLVADPSLIPQAYEEVLRLDGPVFAPVQIRVLTRDVTLHGVTMPAGGLVHLLFGAANRDERVIENPEQFDVHRAPFQQLSFGHGIHECLGRLLARLIARVLLEELLAVAPEYSVTEAGPPFKAAAIRNEWLKVSFA